MAQASMSDIEKIAAVLKAANAEQVVEIEAEIPFWTTSNHNGKMQIKAKWVR